MWVLLLGVAIAFGRDTVTCKHGFPGQTVMTWQSAEVLREAEYARAQRAGRAVDPTPEFGVVLARIERRPAEHAGGRNFDWVVVVDGSEVIRSRGVESIPRPPPIPLHARSLPWRTDNELVVPPGLPDVFEVHLIDKLLGDSCAVRIDRARGKLQKRKPLKG